MKKFCKFRYKNIVIIIIVIILILVALGWKDRYKGIEHLKPQHIKDKEDRERSEESVRMHLRGDTKGATENLLKDMEKHLGSDFMSKKDKDSTS